VRVDRPAIARMFLPSGTLGRWMRLRLTEIDSVATYRAPGRTGNLKAQHYRSQRRLGRYFIRGQVGNRADYAAAVHGGTTGPIVPVTARAMPIPVVRGGLPRRAGGRTFPVGPEFAKTSVRGQRANPWLTGAARRVLARYGVHIP